MVTDKNETLAAVDPQQQIENLIFTVRGVQVMLDRDLARLYEVTTSNLNKAVKRNIERFPEHFMFQLTKDEFEQIKWIGRDSCRDVQDSNLTFQNGISSWGGTRHLPFAFTEQGVSQLSAVLHSKIAIATSIHIIDAFVAMRRFLTANAGMFQRIESLERRQIETDRKIDYVLDSLEEGTLKEKAHIFSSGQVYEAKAFITKLINRAQNRVILIDGYVSSPTIDLLDARKDGVSATIYTGGVGNSLRSLRDQYNIQYPNKPLTIEKWNTDQHDRWLIIDNELWHCGASIRDAGIRTFGIDLIGLDVNIILSQV